MSDVLDRRELKDGTGLTCLPQRLIVESGLAYLEGIPLFPLELLVKIDDIKIFVL